MPRIHVQSPTGSGPTAPGDLYRPASKRPAPPVTMVAGTQPGHAITVTTSATGTWNLNDTSDSMLGTQMVSLTSSTTAETDSFKWTGNLDMTGKGFVFFFKANAQTTGISKVDVQLPSGDGNYSGNVLGPGAYSADQQYAKDGEWVRYYVPFSMCTGTSYLGGTVGTTMARNAITSVRFRFWNKAGQVVTAGFAGFGTYTEPAATFPNGVISLAYDDAYANQFTGARPALDKYGYRGTLFPILERIDSGAGYLTSAQVKHLHDRLGWEVGAHHHRRLPRHRAPRAVRH
jgi:Polysaccharide deacetylase